MEELAPQDIIVLMTQPLTTWITESEYSEVGLLLCPCIECNKEDSFPVAENNRSSYMHSDFYIQIKTADIKGGSSYPFEKFPTRI